MRILFLMTVIFQNVIIAVPNEQPDILKQLKELQQHIQRLETVSRKLMDENDNFKRQIDGLMKLKVTLYTDMEDKIANQNDKIDSQNDKIASQNDKITSQNDKIASQNDKIDETAASVKELKYRPRAVAFRASLAKNFLMGKPETFKGIFGNILKSDKTMYHKEDPVIWKNEEYNIGSGFDVSNGIFTCPYDGIYSFYATSPILRGYGKIVIYVNESYLKANHIGHADNWKEQVSSQGVFRLKKGNTVHIKMEGFFHNAHSYSASTYFEGHLIDHVPWYSNGQWAYKT